MNSKCVAGLFLFFALIPVLPAGAQATDQAASARKDVYIILDVSGSMNENRKFANVKDYLEKEVVRKQLKPGDSFTLITFGDKAAEVQSLIVQGEQELNRASAGLKALRANSDFTDIGMAMEKLHDVLSGRKSASNRQLIMFITDGRHAPPPGSPYRGKNLAIDERFKDIGRKLAMNGWFLYVVGIGDTDARNIAAAVEGSVYRQTSPDFKEVRIEEYLSAVQTAETARAAREAQSAASAESGGPAWPVLAVPGALIVLLAGFLLLRLRPFEIVISDSLAGKPVIITRRLKPRSRIRFNSAQNVLPSVGDAGRFMFTLERGLFSLRIRVVNEQDIAEGSPYRAKGLHRLAEGPIEMANGGKIRFEKA
jgi:Mg-chelatase subunit ChlD